MQIFKLMDKNLDFKSIDFYVQNALKLTYEHLAIKKIFRGLRPWTPKEGEGGRGGRGKGRRGKEGTRPSPYEIPGYACIFTWLGSRRQLPVVVCYYTTSK
jgi:hypothetical protein